MRAALFFSVSVRHCAVVRQFVPSDISSKTTCRNSTICYITFPHGEGVREQHFFSMCPSSFHHSVTLHLSVKLPINHWTEFYQTYFITSPHGKDMREQHYFSVHPSFVNFSVTQSPLKSLDGIQSNLLHHFPSWKGCARATLLFCASLCPSLYFFQTTGRKSTKFATSLPLMVRVCNSKIILSMPPSVRASAVRPSVRHAIYS